MNSYYLNKLDYNKIIEKIKSYTKTSLGSDIVLHLKPSFNHEEVITSLSETSEACSLIERNGNLSIDDIGNPDIYIKTVASNICLTNQGLLNLANVLKVSNDLINYFKTDGIDCDSYAILSSVFSNLYSNKKIQDTILKNILDETNIDDNASKKLSSIRKKSYDLELQIKNELNNYIHSSSYSKYLSDTLVTIKNDRYVIPVKSEYRSKIKGFIHDTSSSGSTVFIEPLSVFELNNSLNNLKIEEKIEIEKILKEYTSMFFPIIDQLKSNIELITKLDVIFAKALYSISINGINPSISEDKQIILKKARHPLIEKDVVVPIDVSLGLDYNCLVITGPNTGGKTVTLKTVGLLCLMAYSGIHIPADEQSSIYVFDNIYIDIGDEQSIQSTLSTFSSHITNIVSIINNASNNSLILLDELGAGTDPIEGSNLAISILEHLYNNSCLIIATTHYSQIKKYALVKEGFKNASVEFDVNNLKPTYKLLIGIPGKSNAFSISKKLGLSESILKRASSLIDKNNYEFEDVLKSIYDEKKKIDIEKKEIEKNLNQISRLRQSLEKENKKVLKKSESIIEKAKNEARDILFEAKEYSSTIIKELNKNYNVKDLEHIRNNINDSIKKLSKPHTNEDENSDIQNRNINIGDTILVSGYEQEGIVISISKNKKKIEVQIGSMHTYVNSNDVIVLEQTKKEKIHSTISSTISSKSKNINSEINLIGLNSDEAISILEKYLDDASLTSLKKLRIVHGKGTGKLKSSIHAYLKNHPLVNKYYLASYGEGDSGVTIIELK